VILDTAGRLHVDAELMDELEDIRAKTNPAETWLVVDAQAGQDALASAKEFDRRLALTGVLLSKTDGDARAGVALSLREAIGKPIRYVGVGERLEALEPFVPTRVAGRILGMGDVVGLVEKAEEVVDRAEAQEQAERLFRDAWTLDDFRAQLRQIRALSSKMGGLKGMLKMVPGAAQAPEGALDEVDESKFGRFESAIDSMTLAERLDPKIVNGQRRARIARGSGVSVATVNELLKSYKMMRLKVKELKSSGLLGRLAGRRFDKDKARQLEDLKRRGVDVSEWFPPE
jgi:signal recognition particle subunit SRP54